MIDPSLSHHLKLALLRGEMTAEQAAARAVLDRRVEALRRRRKADWPTPSIVWDLDPARWHRSMDDHDQASFTEAFPDIALAWVDLDDLHAELAEVSRRIHDPLHQKYRSKTARLVMHLEDGGAVSPPFIVHSQTGLVVAGGNHRLGWARRLGEAEIPILFRRSSQSRIEALVGLRATTDGYGFRST